MLIEYVESARKQFLYYKHLGEKTFDQLKDVDLFWSPKDNMNSISIIIQHLSGNMISRWTDFLTSDGEKDFRNREKEFITHIDHVEELMEKWEEGWNCLFHALDSIKPEHHSHIIYIRSKGHTIPEAINRQLCHYSYHIGQIVYIGMQKSDKWQSLSIPKGGSEKYNAQSNARGKRIEHFTENLTTKDKLSE